MPFPQEPEHVSPRGTPAAFDAISWSNQHQQQQSRAEWNSAPKTPTSRAPVESHGGQTAEDNLRAVIMIMTGYNKTVDDLLRHHFAANRCNCPKKQVDLMSLQHKNHEEHVPSSPRHDSYSSMSSSSSRDDRGSASSASSSSSRSTSRKPSVAEFAKPLPTVHESSNMPRSPYTNKNEQDHFSMNNMVQALDVHPAYRRPSETPQSHQRRPSEIAPDEPVRRPSETPNWNVPYGAGQRKLSTAYNAAVYDQTRRPSTGRAAYDEAEEKARGYSVSRERERSEWGSVSLGSGEHLPTDLATMAAMNDRKGSVASVSSDRKMSTFRKGSVANLGGARKASVAAKTTKRRPSDWGSSLAGLA